MQARSGLLLLLSGTLYACLPQPRPETVESARSSANAQVAPGRAGIGAALSPADSAWIEATLATLTPRERIGQMVMPWVGGEYAAVGSPEFEQMRRWVEVDGVGGFVISIGLPHSYGAKLNQMQRRAKVGLLIGSDMENGTGMRLANIYAIPSMLAQGGGTVFPPVMSLGAAGSPELAYELGRVLGREARAVGVHMVFGPVLDVNSNPLNPVINVRSFGEDPTLVGRLGDAYIRGARASGLMTAAKHFPGHGDTDVNSHIGLPEVKADSARLSAVDLPPFRDAVAAGVDAIMTGHIAAVGIEGPDAPPATLSPRFMHSLLRGQMGFRGLLVTDAMTMGAVSRRYGATEPLVLAVLAGADILLMPKDVTTAIATIEQAVTEGRITRSRIDESVRRILRAKVQAGLHRGRLVDLNAIDTIVNVPGHAAIAQTVAERSITLARDNGLVPLPSGRVLVLTYAGPADRLAGRVFNDEIERSRRRVRTISVDDRTTAAELAGIRALMDSVDVTIASMYVAPSDDAESVGTGSAFGALIEEASKAGRKIVGISFGSPYLLGAFPSIPAYMLAWGPAPVSQLAAARALLGINAIGGKLPVSLPPVHRIGEGTARAAAAPAR